MLLSCSDKVSNITISPSSPKNCYKPISKIAPIYSAKTVSSSWWQCKLLGWIMSVSFRGVYQRGSITHRPKSEREAGPGSPPSLPPSLPHYQQLVCCHGTACRYCSGHKMVPSHATTWQHWKPYNCSASRRRHTMWNARKKTASNGRRSTQMKVTLTLFSKSRVFLRQSIRVSVREEWESRVSPPSSTCPNVLFEKSKPINSELRQMEAFRVMSEKLGTQEIWSFFCQKKKTNWLIRIVSIA